MTLIVEHLHNQYGSAIYAKNSALIDSAMDRSSHNCEILTVEMKNLCITTVYKPPHEELVCADLESSTNNKPHILIGDFNSHHQNWGYRDNDANGEALVSWAEANRMTILHDPKLPSSFNSGQWKRGYNPDLAMIAEDLNNNSKKIVLSPIPHTQHRPIGVCIIPVVQAKDIPMRRRFNFKKANWTSFENSLDQLITQRQLEPTIENYNTFVEMIKTASRKTIPRGCRRKFIPGLSEEHMDLYEKYQDAFTNDPFSKETSEIGENLIECISEQKRSNWQKLIEETDMKHSSRKAWKTMKILSNDNTKACPHPNVTANQVAMQLVDNGKTSTKKER